MLLSKLIGFYKLFIARTKKVGLMMNDEFMVHLDKQITEIQLNMQPIIDAANQALRSTVPVINRINEYRNAMQPIIHQAYEVYSSIQPTLNAVSKNLSPIVTYIQENQNRIESFMRSVDAIADEYDLSDESLIDELERLEKEDEVYIDDEWEIEQVSDKPKDNKSKSKMSLKNLLDIVQITVGLLTLSQPSDSPFVEVDNSTTHIEENHYHVELYEKDLHRNTAINSEKINVYADSNIDASILGTVNSGDKANAIGFENGYTLVVVLDDKNEIKVSGWVENKYLDGDSD